LSSLTLRVSLSHGVSASPVREGYGFAMYSSISSVHNPRVKEAVQLRRRRGRDRQDRVLIDGVREIRRALEAGVPLVEVFACPEHCDAAGRQLIEDCRRRSYEVLTVTPAVFEKLAFGDRADGVIATAIVHSKVLADMSLAGRGLVVVLEAVEKPGNVGAVVRTADAVGASAVVVTDLATDLYNPNAIRASVGAIFTVPVCTAGGAETLAWLRGQGLRILAARVDGAVPYTEVSYVEPCALVLGSEVRGLSDVWRGAEVTAIRLPMLGCVDSLNVSITAAVVLYEALRQRLGAAATRDRV
jgi:RNA methyltransferase, TrmH family